jgi:hypothetical protein
MIPLNLDLSGYYRIPPDIPELIVDGVTISDFKGNTAPMVFRAVICTGCAHCMIPVSMLDHIFPTAVGSIKVKDFRDPSATVTTEIYEIQVFTPRDKAFKIYTIATPCSQILFGRSALKNRSLNMNFATGKGALSD